MARTHPDIANEKVSARQGPTGNHRSSNRRPLAPQQEKLAFTLQRKGPSLGPTLRAWKSLPQPPICGLIGPYTG